jgi:uncharacterized protein
MPPEALSGSAAALFARIRGGDVAGVATLLEAEPALARSRDANGVSALMFAVYHRAREVADLLASRAAPLDLFEAVAMDRLELVDELTAANPQAVRSRSADGFTPLHFACFFAHLPIASLLLSRGAEVRAVAANGMRVEPLHSAAASNRIDVVALMLAAGAAVDAVQEGGFTALHAAAQHGNMIMTRLLLAAGADPQIPSDDGKTAADHARGVGHEVVAALLAERARG